MALALFSILSKDIYWAWKRGVDLLKGIINNEKSARDYILLAS